MKEQRYEFEGEAPFNMAIATLLSLRNTLDRIRDVEAMFELPEEERQRIKITLVQSFYVDSSPLIFDKKTIDKFSWILDVTPDKYVSVDKSGKHRNRIGYSHELNKKLNSALIELQVELQIRKYFMPPKADMSTIAGRMS